MLIQEEWVNQTENYVIGDSGEHEPFTDNIKELFKSLQKEYGKCISKIYIDTKTNPIAVGWIFEKKVKYTDCEEYYLQDTWVSLHTKKTKTIHKHFYKKI